MFQRITNKDVKNININPKHAAANGSRTCQSSGDEPVFAFQITASHCTLARRVSTIPTVWSSPFVSCLSNTTADNWTNMFIASIEPVCLLYFVKLTLPVFVAEHAMINPLDTA